MSVRTLTALLTGWSQYDLEVLSTVGRALIEVGHVVLCWGLETFGEAPDASGLHCITGLDCAF